MGDINKNDVLDSEERRFIQSISAMQSFHFVETKRQRNNVDKMDINEECKPLSTDCIVLSLENLRRFLTFSKFI